MDPDTLWVICALFIVFAVGMGTGLFFAARHELRSAAKRRHPANYGMGAEHWRQWVRHHGD